MAEKALAPLSNRELQAFSSQLAMILKAGISCTEGITILSEDAHTEAEHHFLATVLDTLNQTGSLYVALKETNTCPAYFLSMIQLGEQTGTLDDAMEALSNYYGKEEELSQTIRSAVSYPLLMIGMMLAVIFILITKVMPIFNQVFQQFGSTMTGISRGFLDIGIFLNQHALAFTLFLACIIAIFFYLFYTFHGQKHLRRLMMHLRVIRQLDEKISARRFADGMALTLHSGLNPADAVHLSIQLVDSSAYFQRLQTLESAVAGGTDLYDALNQHHIFSGLYSRIASIGSKTGSMDEAMKKIADAYEIEIDGQINHLVSAIEPTLVIILSILVGIILLSVMLPLVSLMSGM